MCKALSIPSRFSWSLFIYFRGKSVQSANVTNKSMIPQKEIRALPSQMPLWSSWFSYYKLDQRDRRLLRYEVCHCRMPMIF